MNYAQTLHFMFELEAEILCLPKRALIVAQCMCMSQ